MRGFVVSACVTSRLQPQLRKEKVELERHLEAEQEYFVNKLQKQLLEITRQKKYLLLCLRGACCIATQAGTYFARCVLLPFRCCLS